MIKKESTVPENLILSKNKRSFILAYSDKKYEYSAATGRANMKGKLQLSSENEHYLFSVMQRYGPIPNARSIFQQ